MRRQHVAQWSPDTCGLRVTSGAFAFLSHLYLEERATRDVPVASARRPSRPVSPLARFARAFTARLTGTTLLRSDAALVLQGVCWSARAAVPHRGNAIDHLGRPPSVFFAVAHWSMLDASAIESRARPASACAPSARSLRAPVRAAGCSIVRRCRVWRSPPRP